MAYESFGTNKSESLNSGQLIDQFNLRSISCQQSVPDITTSESVARFRDLHQVISQRGDLQEAKKKLKKKNNKVSDKFNRREDWFEVITG